jgi:hypothetical protein
MRFYVDTKIFFFDKKDKLSIDKITVLVCFYKDKLLCNWFFKNGLFNFIGLVIVFNTSFL